MISFYRSKKLGFIAVGLALVSVFAFSSVAAVAGEKKETLKVWGNCGKCKKTIESALKDVDGVVSASWDKKTKVLSVTFDDAKISLKEIEEKVAATGYDTQNAKGSDEAYKNLDKCCKYKRKES
jgi:copper chaperone CopZ